MDSGDVERAKAFWSHVDVDFAFEELLDFIMSLRTTIKNRTASDKEYVKGMNIFLQAELSMDMTLQDPELFGEAFFNQDILTVSVSDSHYSMLKIKEGSMMDGFCQDTLRNPESRPDNGHNGALLLSPTDLLFENHLGPMSPLQAVYQQHDCGPHCLSHLPPHSDHFLNLNPLRVPLLCHFQRFWQTPVTYTGEDEEDGVDMDVLYKAPCGRGLRSMDDVFQFLQQTNSFKVLQPTNFSFNPLVQHELQFSLSMPGSGSGVPTAGVCERDVSRGMEAFAIPLCNELDTKRPKEFRYRKERWPHGCFLSKSPFFSTCCDCKDGCLDSHHCACLQLALKGGAKPEQLCKYQRLESPVPTGLYECGPWCDCERSRCQNRVVQRGLRVRLQVFRTPEKGWGVRCRDDLEKGSFICTYSGVVLRLRRSLEEAPSSKSQKDEAPSDDEVEVVEEWTLPTGLKKTLPGTVETSSPLYVPVIQRSDDLPAAVQKEAQEEVQEEAQEQAECNEKQQEDKSSPLHNSNTPEHNCQENEGVMRKKPRLNDGTENEKFQALDQTVPGEEKKHGSQDEMYYLDASKEGNVARFINHSCNPNLFVQNVFVDTHDPKFPMIAFFTSRAIKAGTELTWNYGYKPGTDLKHEVECQCGDENCQAVVI